MASPYVPWQKRLQLAFSQALQRDPELRVSWLAVLRAQCRNGGPVVPVTPEDEPLLQKLERLLPLRASIRLGALLAKISMRAPDVAALQPDLWLMSMALNYQVGIFRDPCKPRGPRGSPQRLQDAEALCREILQWMRGRIRQGSSIDDLTEEHYVRYRWPNRYGHEDDLHEGHPLHLVRMILDRKSKGRASKPGIQSGVRLLRYHLKPSGYTWAMLKQQALTEA
jgi:hypothetical protein